MIIALIACGLFLAYANGANDNFKGVATLYGSGLVSYQKALAFTTVTTFLGSCTSIFLAKGLIAVFSGKGLVPVGVVQMPTFALSVAGAAAITVMFATRLGFPISTTHALTGALVGAGLTAAAEGVALSKLGAVFFLPLILSPLISLAMAYAFFPLLTKLSPPPQCLCITSEVTAGENVIAASASPFVVAEQKICNTSGATEVASFNPQKALDHMHFLSAGLVCFARGLNDTPKLAALLLMVPFLTTNSMILAIATAMAVGGLIHSKKIAETMAHKVTSMNHQQGFAANFVTALVVNLGTKLQLPISTTHVSVGTLFGIRAHSKSGNLTTIKQILAAWVITLPLASLLGFALFNLITRLHA